jgi:IS5 family transposase
MDPQPHDARHLAGAKRSACVWRHRARNRTKSKVRAKVEHACLVIKRIVDWAKVCYQGLAKNTHWLQIRCGLANLYMARRRLLAGA